MVCGSVSFSDSFVLFYTMKELGKSVNSIINGFVADTVVVVPSVTYLMCTNEKPFHIIQTSLLPLQMAELLLSQGCVVNACDKQDRRALHWAAHMGYEDVVRLLINHAADVNVKDRHVSAV